MRTRRSQSSSGPVAPAVHLPVLLQEAIEQLAIQNGDIVVDATLGGAGHAKKLVDQLGDGTFIGFDLDSEAIARAEKALADAKVKVHLVRANFRDIAREVPKLGTKQITKALFDLGWSSYQLDSGRGFSFLKDEPLSMTYAHPARPDTLTAAMIVNNWPEVTLADVIYAFGGERYSLRIAKAIVEQRQKKQFVTSGELAATVSESVPGSYQHGKIHPATRTFQALRMAVNDELGALQEGIRGAWHLLAPGGRIAVISFHSLEDRAVKQLFKELATREGTLVLKKPLAASLEEVRGNKRARSAKLRVIQKNAISHEESYPKNKQIRPVDIPGEI